MTTPTNPALAEFVAGLMHLVKVKSKNDVWSIWSFGVPHQVDWVTMFEDDKAGPIIRHLVEEEMERRGFHWVASETKTVHKYMWTFINEDKIEFHGLDEKNKTRAVALAAWGTGER